MKPKSFLYKIIIIIIYGIICFTIYNKNITTKIKSNTLKEKNIQSNKLKNSIEKPYLYLQINKINLYKPIYSIESKQNDVEKNIEILTKTSHPNENNSHIILAAHSGPGTNAYFNEIDKLNINDDIIITYNKNKYIYTIKDIWQENKNGYIHLKPNTKNTLVLTTCSKINGKQLIIMATQNN